MSIYNVHIIDRITADFKQIQLQSKEDFSQFLKAFFFNRPITTQFISAIYERIPGKHTERAMVISPLTIDLTYFVVAVTHPEDKAYNRVNRSELIQLISEYYDVDISKSSIIPFRNTNTNNNMAPSMINRTVPFNNNKVSYPPRTVRRGGLGKRRSRRSRLTKKRRSHRR